MSQNDDYEVDERTGAWTSPAHRRDHIAQKWAQFLPAADPVEHAEAVEEPEPIGRSSVIPGAGSSPGYEAQEAMAKQYAQTEDKTTQLARLLGWP